MTIATGEGQRDAISSQLGNTVDIVTEPERRDTFPAIALACLYLEKEKRCAPDEVVVVMVMPSDPYTDENCFRTIGRMAAAVERGTSDLVLMDGGALWNGGVFAFRLGYLKALTSHYLQAATFGEARDRYGELPKISFDYEVAEKAESVAVIPFNGLWKDLGTWDALSEVIGDKAIGNVLMDGSCHDTHVVNTLDMPCICAETDNLIVAASPDGILVAGKDSCERIKPLVSQINTRPMFEERRWRTYKVVDRYEAEDGRSRSLTKHLCIQAGKSISYQWHFHRDEVWTFVDGTGILVIDGEEREVKCGDVVHIRKGQKHAVKALTDLHFIEVQTGDVLEENDIERMEWELKRNANEKRKREELIGKLQESNAKNEELIRLRRNFIQNVSHELRTPLTAISGNAELLLNDDNRDSRMRHAEIIKASAGRMASMLNSLLDYFRLDSRKVTILSKPFKLSQIADTLETEFAMQAKSKHLTLTVRNHANEVVNGDKNRILSIGGNLLSNAIKFTDKGTITLTTQYKDGVFTLTVEDTGTGISKEQKERIFKPFERLGNATTQDGFGLGLSIVKQLVELVDGSISVESEKEKGSRFIVSLPLVVAEETTANTRLSVVSNSLSVSGCSVLVIDNDTVTLGMIRDMLVQNGVSCDACLTAGELTDKLRSKDYNLLITDLKMPDMNGYEVLELLRTSDIGNSRTSPVVAATAAGFITEDELKSAGFTAMLGKPFSIAELLNVVSQYANKEHKQLPDFSALLAFGDRLHTLERLIMETKKEMDEVRKATETKDMEALDGWIHHLRSSWMLMKAEQPLQELYAVIHNGNPTNGEIAHAVQKVLAQGKLIVDLARKEMERWEG